MWSNGLLARGKSIVVAAHHHINYEVRLLYKLSPSVTTAPKFYVCHYAMLEHK